MLPDSSEHSGTTPQAVARVVIVDDHPLFREGLRRVVEGEPDMVVCGEADCSLQALEVARTTAPDIVVVDLCLKGGSGLDLIRDLRSALPKMPVLMLSMYHESVYAERAMRAGAAGYIMKEEAPQRIVSAIREVLSGHVHMSLSVSSQILRKAISHPGVAGNSPATPESGMDQLSHRELEVFELIGQGLSNRRIAERLFRSVKTIESHRENIKQKLGLGSSAELVRYAVEHCLHLHRPAKGEAPLLLSAAGAEPPAWQPQPPSA